MPPRWPPRSLPVPGAFELMSNASLIVQMVLLLLVGFSVLSWAIIIYKWSSIRRAARNADRFLDVFWSGKSMDHIYSESKKFAGAPVAKIFQSGYLELQRLLEKERQKTGSTSVDAISNLERSRSRAGRTETQRLERSLTFLATTGSTSPFIGLFGTVLGHHERVPKYRRARRREPADRGARNRRSAHRDRHGPRRRDPRRDGLQLFTVTRSATCGSRWKISPAIFSIS